MLSKSFVYIGGTSNIEIAVLKTFENINKIHTLSTTPSAIAQ